MADLTPATVALVDGPLEPADVVAVAREYARVELAPAALGRLD